MVLAVKIRDNILIPEDAIDSFQLGEGYFKAEKLLSKPYDDKKCFGIFKKTMFENFEIIRAYNLYYQCDSNYIAKGIQSYEHITINYLHYFGFQIEKYPNKKQLELLEKMRANNLIEYYWFEGKTYKTTVKNPKTENSAEPLPLEQSKIPKNNFYVTDLALTAMTNRGAGANIIAFEDTGTHLISELSASNPYLSHFKSRTESVSRIGGKNPDGDFAHQIKTLVTLFAQSPPNERFQVDGLAVHAELEVSTVKPFAPTENEDYIGKVRKNLGEMMLTEKKNAILLFEFEVDFIDEKNKNDTPLRFPILMFPDITNLLSDLAISKNFIVITAAGNSNFDFDTLENAPWKLNTQRFNDLSQNNPFALMIGATIKENEQFVKSPFNRSDNLDAYLYTDFFVGKKENSTEKAIYEGTSGAVAIAAGIITCLQGKAINEGKALTTEIIKNVFQKTFMKNYPDQILTPTTLEKLWEACLEELEQQ